MTEQNVVLEETRQRIFDAVRKPLVERFLPNRYPHTYGADFLRQNPRLAPVSAVEAAFRFEEDRTEWWGARSAAIRVATSWAHGLDLEPEDLLTALADAYLEQERIEKTGGV